MAVRVSPQACLALIVMQSMQRLSTSNIMAASGKKDWLYKISEYSGIQNYFWPAVEKYKK
jgi:hypothetical protein